MKPPDAIGELIGVRAWRLVEGMLWSLYRPVAWVPGKPVQASCMTAVPVASGLPSSPGHRSPSQGCRCGLYAALRAPEGSNRCSDASEELAGLLGLPKGSSGDFVLGEVAGWGRAEIATKGWRSEYQRVRAIYDTHPQAGFLSDVYDVPLVTP